MPADERKGFALPAVHPEFPEALPRSGAEAEPPEMWEMLPQGHSPSAHLAAQPLVYIQVHSSVNNGLATPPDAFTDGLLKSVGNSIKISISD